MQRPPPPSRTVVALLVYTHPSAKGAEKSKTKRQHDGSEDNKAPPAKQKKTDRT